MSLNKKAQEELKKREAKKEELQGKKIEQGDFVLVNITAKTQKGNIFRVSSVEDAKKSGIYNEESEKQGHYTPEFVIVGKPGILNEGLKTLEDNEIAPLLHFKAEIYCEFRDEEALELYLESATLTYDNKEKIKILEKGRECAIRLNKYQKAEMFEDLIDELKIPREQLGRRFTQIFKI